MTTAVSNAGILAEIILLQPDGKIIDAGEADLSKKGKWAGSDFAAVRYNSDGSLDTSFGTAGKVIGPADASQSYTHAALYPTAGTADDGKIVVGGLAGGFSIARYNRDGALDAAFGSKGIATAPFALISATYFLIYQP